MKKVIGLVVIAATTFWVFSIGQASEAKQHEGHSVEERTGLHLSHDLKAVLNQEMNEIQEGMMKMIPAISAGNWEVIADVAARIENSFILKQELTREQIEELHDSLPAEFVEMDHGFHSTAGKLAHAAHEHDGELVNFYFYKLHTQCTKCHSKYATERFPNLKKLEHDESDTKD